MLPSLIRILQTTTNPEGEDRIGNASNVVFSNGWVAKKNGEVLIYYDISDTRMYIA